MIPFFIVGALSCVVAASPFDFGLKEIPPYGIPLIPPPEVEEKEATEKGLEIAKELSFEKAWPWLEKEFSFDNGMGVGIGIGKEMEFEKAIGFGIGKEVGMERSAFIPWALWEKYFGTVKKLTFEQSLALELYKKYGYYGLWVAKELERRFSIAKRLGLIGQEIAFQEAITIGLFKGIGLDKIFESALKAIGVEKSAATAASKELSFDKIWGLWNKF